MAAGTDLGRVWVQVIDVDVAADREITFGKSLAEGLGDRQDDIQSAIDSRLAGGSEEPEVAGLAGGVAAEGGVGHVRDHSDG